MKLSFISNKIIFIILIFTSIFLLSLNNTTVAENNNASKDCRDINIVYARGSGSSLNSGIYNELTSRLSSSFDKKGISYNFYELGSETYNDHNYPAVGLSLVSKIGAELFWGSILGSSYRGSTESGLSELRSYINARLVNCPDSLFVLSGFSQGAQTVGDYIEASPSNQEDHLVYAALFGDPKLYLPEGRGIWPSACRGGSYSPWRRGNISCKVDSGILDGRNPYMSDKLYYQSGSWCEKNDSVCTDNMWKAIFGSDSHSQETYINKKYVKNASKEIVDAVVDRLGIGGGPINPPAAFVAPASLPSLASKNTNINTINLLSNDIEEIESPVNLISDIDEYFVKPGEQVTFDMSRSYHDDDWQIYQYDWDFDGDGIIDKYTQSPITTYVYNNAFDGHAIVTGHGGFGDTNSLSIAIHANDNALTEIEPLDAPNGLSIVQSNISDTKKDVKVSWNSVDGAGGYTFYIDGVPVGYLLNNELSTTLKEVPNNSEFTFGVSAISEQSSSSKASINVPIVDVPIPEPEPSPVKQSLACKLLKLIKPFTPKIIYNLLSKLAHCS